MVFIFKKEKTRFIKTLKQTSVIVSKYCSDLCELGKLLFPTYCLSCKCLNPNIICETCFNSIKFCLQKHGDYGINLSEVKTLSLYKGAGKVLLEHLKFNGSLSAGKYLNKWLIKKLLQNMQEVDYYIAVPSFKSKRKYNVLDILFKNCFHENECNKPYAFRIKNTKPLNKLNKRQREKELQNCFKIINGELLFNKKVCVYDDILTSGSTIKELTKELLKYKPLKIEVICMFYKEKNDIEKN